MQHIYTNISNKIKDLATESNSDVMIYYADLESFPLSSEAEMNKTDREFFEYLRKNYSSEKNKKLILLIHLGGGLLKAATDLIRFLRIEYQNSITTIVCKFNIRLKNTTKDFPLSFVTSTETRMTDSTGASRSETLTYIDSMLIELRKMGQSIDEVLLVYLIELAMIEVSDLGASSRANGD